MGSDAPDSRARTSPSSALLPVTALLAGVVALVVGNGMVGTLVVLRLDLDAQAPWVAGAVMTAYYAGFFGGAVLAPRWIGAVGLIRCFAAAAALCASAAIAHGIGDGPWLWGGLRALGGVAWAVLLVTVETWLSAHSDGRARAVVLAAYMMLFYAASGAGQFVLAAFDPAEGRLFAAAGLSLCLAVVPVALTRHGAPSPPAAEFLGPARILRRAPLTISASLGSGVLMGCLLALGPLYARSLGFDAAEAARWLGVAVLSGLLLQWPVGRLSERLGHRHAIGLVASALTGVAAALWLFVDGTGPLAYAGAAAFGALATTVYPLALSHAADWFQEHERSAACSTLVMATALGSVVGPILASACMSWLGPRALFLPAAAVAALVALHAGGRLRIPRPGSIGKRTPFVAVPHTTPTVMDLDARTDEEG